MQVCIHHIGELFLFEYYKKPGEYVNIQEDVITPLLSRAEEEEKRGGLIGALQNYEKALELNPVSTFIYFKMISCCYRLSRLQEIHDDTAEVYPYLATRAEMAQFYRWLGYYYLESYQPKLSAALYRYSTYFEKSRQAENEIRFLETAMNKKMPAYTTRQLQSILQDAKIPLQASNVTLALLVRAGEEAESAGNLTQALDCYSMVYDTSHDAELGRRIIRIREISG